MGLLDFDQHGHQIFWSFPRSKLIEDWFWQHEVVKGHFFGFWRLEFYLRTFFDLSFLKWRLWNIQTSTIGSDLYITRICDFNLILPWILLLTWQSLGSFIAVNTYSSVSDFLANALLSYLVSHVDFPSWLLKSLGLRARVIVSYNFYFFFNLFFPGVFVFTDGFNP